MPLLQAVLRRGEIVSCAQLKDYGRRETNKVPVSAAGKVLTL